MHLSQAISYIFFFFQLSTHIYYPVTLTNNRSFSFTTLVDDTYLVQEKCMIVNGLHIIYYTTNWHYIKETLPSHSSNTYLAQENGTSYIEPYVLLEE